MVSRRNRSCCYFKHGEIRVNLKKILNILIFLAIVLNTAGCLVSYAASDIETQKKQTREKINRLKWLESVETNKLYKNQQKLENATNNLSSSKTQIASAQKELNSLEARLSKASADYNALNFILATHIRSVYKNQRKAFFEILLNSEDINMLVDRIYYQKLLLKDDYNRMTAAKAKAQEIATLKYNIEARKRNLERSVASINSQQAYIQKAIAKNESMINKLRTDRVAYQKAEKELAKQGNSIVYVVRNKEIIAIIGVNDTLRENAKEVMQALKKNKIETIMLTGDNEETAKKIAEIVGIDQVIANVLPQEKAEQIRKLKQSGQFVLMCGDGINDSPALASCDIGVSVGNGTDIAMDSAEVILTQNNLERIEDLIHVSQKTIRNIKQNLFWAFFYNALMIPIAMGVLSPIGITINPMIASLAMVFSSLTVIGNALRLRSVLKK